MYKVMTSGFPFTVVLIAAVVIPNFSDNLPPDASRRFAFTAGAMAADAKASPESPAALSPTIWSATAPGTVEPRKGRIAISPQTHGRIVELLVELNDRVATGDLMIRLDDDEAHARLRAAAALADARKRTRDNNEVNYLATKRRDAYDAVHEARRTLREAREDLDDAAARARDGSGTRAEHDLARKSFYGAKNKLAKVRAGLRKTRSTGDMPLQTSPESALSAARAQLALAEVALERTQIRAPNDGTIMEVLAKLGETVAPSPQSVLLRMGDLTALRVRVEIDERDIDHVGLGQLVMVRSKAFPGKKMTGRVSSLAPGLGPGTIAAKTLRGAAGPPVLEAKVELDGVQPLRPGMRVDVFFGSVPARR